MKQVLHLIDTYRVGGPGKTILNSARFIDESRFRVHVGSFTSADQNRNEFAAAVRTAGVPFLDLRETRRVNPGHVLQIRDYVRRNDIAIVHTHGYRTDLLGYLASRGLSGTRIVTTHHGWIRNRPRQHLMAKGALWLAQRFDGVEVVTEKLRQELPRALRGSARVAVVHNAIVLEDYRVAGCRADIRRSLGMDDSAVLIGVVGRLSLEKGCVEMLDAFARVAAAVDRAHLLFIGEGPLEAEIRRGAEAPHLQGRVRLIGHQPRIQPFFEALDVVVSPSRSEGLSNVILEALALGKPVVATRVGGTPEIIEDGTSGLLVEPCDPGALAAAVLRVIEDDALRRTLLKGGGDRIDVFDFRTRMRHEERFYTQILGESPDTDVASSVAPIAPRR